MTHREGSGKRFRFLGACAALASVVAVALSVVTTSAANAPAHHLVRDINQPEQRRGNTITIEASTIHVIQCDEAPNKGRQFYIYEYLKRRAFRAISPPDWGHAIGGRDFATEDEAITAACGASPDAGAPRPDAGAPRPDAGAPTTGGPEKEILATIQQPVPPATFEREVASDPALQAAVALAKQKYGVTSTVRAGEMADPDGVSLIYGAMEGPNGKSAVVVRHCKASDCISVVQQPTPDGGDFTWEGPHGMVPVRTVRMPLWLRIVGDNPDQDAVLGTTAQALTNETAGAAEAAPRKLRIFSNFNQYMTMHGGVSFESVVTLAKNGPFPDASTLYNGKASQLDNLLSTLGQTDALVVVAHGDRSKSKGRVSGMTVNQDGWGEQHYDESRFLAQLGKNSTGGPGLLFLAGCETEGLLPSFDSKTRIVLGFVGDVTPGLGHTVMTMVFDELGSGKTFKEALAKANDFLEPQGLGIKANPSADLSRKLVTVGAPGTCPPDLAGNWKGTLTVSKGNPKDKTWDFACPVYIDAGQSTSTTPQGGVVFSTGQGDNPDGTCKGCWITAQVYGGTRTLPRTMAGCASGNTAELDQFDSVPTLMASNINEIHKDTLAVTLTVETRQDTTTTTADYSGTLSRCPGP